MIKSKWLEWQRNNRFMTMPIFTFPALKAINTTVKEVVKDASKQAQLIKYIANNYQTSVALGFMDLSVEAEAFGSKVRFFENDVPTIIGSIIKTSEDARNIEVPSPFNGRTGTYIDGIKKTKSLVVDKPVFAGAIGPFSLAGRLMDMTEIMINCYINPEVVELTLEKTTDFIIKYINAFKSVGADGIFIAEPAAGLLSPELCQKFSTNYIKKIKAAVSDESFVFGYHNCGNVLPLVNEIIDIEADIYHFGEAVDIEDMLKAIPKEALVMGNINPSKFIHISREKEIYNDTVDLLKRCNKYDNFVISTGCDIPNSAPLSNVQAYFDGVTDFYSND